MKNKKKCEVVQLSPTYTAGTGMIVSGKARGETEIETNIRGNISNETETETETQSMEWYREITLN